MSQKSFEKTCVGGDFADRARKLDVDDLGKCGDELRGRGELERGEIVGKCPWALLAEGYDISRLMLWAEAYTSG